MPSIVGEPLMYCTRLARMPLLCHNCSETSREKRALSDRNAASKQFAKFCLVPPNIGHTLRSHGSLCASHGTSKTQPYRTAASAHLSDACQGSHGHILSSRTAHGGRNASQMRGRGRG